MTSEKQTHSNSKDAQDVDQLDEPVDGLTVFLFLGGGFGLFAMLATVAVSGLQLNAGDNARFALGTGQFGDSFGFVTSIFTGLAFLGLLISVRLQRKELRELKEERNETKKLLKSQIEGADQAQASRESRDLLGQIFMLIDRIREHNIKVLQKLDEEEKELLTNYKLHLKTGGTADFKIFRTNKMTAHAGASRYKHTRSLRLSWDRIERLMAELASVSDSISDDEVSELYRDTWSHSPASNDSGQSLVELTLSLEERLWNMLPDTELRLDYRMAITQMLDEVMNDQFQCVFAASVLSASFRKQSYSKLLWNFLRDPKLLGLHNAEKKIQLIMMGREVALDATRVVTIRADEHLKTE